MEEVTAYVDDRKKVYEDIIRVLEIQQLFIGKFDVGGMS